MTEILLLEIYIVVEILLLIFTIVTFVAVVFPTAFYEMS